MSQLNKKLIVIINGKGGCGKDTLINSLTKYSYENISSIDLVKQAAEVLGVKEDDKIMNEQKYRKFLSEIKRLSVEYNDYIVNDLVRKAVLFLDPKTDKNILFVHIREPKEIEKFLTYKDWFNQFNKNYKVVTLLVKSDKTNDKYYDNKSDCGVENFSYHCEFINDFNDKDGSIERFNKLFDDIDLI